ncbi:MAG: ABC transporter ATP-binding protein [Candidatus Eremiobacteraeota bacterium]|nr:ABC transporter ATP-binding protein [Candidatus Eremiobacteraeota bacterium]
MNVPGPTKGAPVSFESVSVRYPKLDRNAVDDVSFEIPASSFTVFLGPSGCGKSTLLRTVNRLVVPASGRVTVDGRDVADAPPEQLRRGIGYVIQAVGLFSHLTVAQNIAVVPQLVGWDRDRITKRVDELLALVALDASRYRGRYPRELSGGEQQRVGVARAIAAEPPVLLMDEPFGAVDAIVRASLQDETRRIARTLKTTILFVTHDVDEALRLADRIVVLREGKVVQYDTPLAILTAPATEYVERLLDTHDVVRRLSLMQAADAMRAPVAATDGAIAAHASLRESLALFLQGAQTLAVTNDGTIAGALTFDDIQQALRR